MLEQVAPYTDMFYNMLIIRIFGMIFEIALIN